VDHGLGEIEALLEVADEARSDQPADPQASTLKRGSLGAQAIPDAIHKRWPWIRHLFADGAYDRTRLLDKAAFLDSSSKLSPHRQALLAISAPWLGSRSEVGRPSPPRFG
jgi:hypothetical protein